MTTPIAYLRKRQPTTRKRRAAITARDRARIIISLDGQHWIVSDDPRATAELREIAARLADVLVASVEGAK